MPDNGASAPFIAVDGVGYAVAGRPILHGVSLHSNARRMGIVGRNGSGKSTLARLLAGLLKPTDGAIRIAGNDIYEDRKAALSTVGILFQNPEHQIIFPTVIEEIAFGLRQQGANKADARAMATKVLGDFGKDHWADAAIQSLSQGQKHLVCMMAVVAMRPALIVLDEPFAGLDIPTRHQLSRYLNGGEARLLHISHHPEDLHGYDEVFWIDQGQIREAGDAQTVLTRYVEEMILQGKSDDLSHLSR
ncbi:ABC transporter ATP-binding protein [Ochrobactrum sp. Q0168]|uniref:energy-coupling factor ABC transporter ATP-binding protein n=1 Tax=Ochrobactrum sp. Q0168 TaxID=2793241 RepID=UPI0018ED2461|nr:ABC transporter ATP-binding protein [Ochrobactrum sp. Q0168]